VRHRYAVEERRKRYDAVMSAEVTTREAINNLLAAIESRDLRAVRQALHPAARWQNVPHPASEGRDAVIRLLGGILTWSDSVRWDVHRFFVSGTSASVERLDRFWLRGNEYAVACHGVFSVDADTGLVISVRDYVDLGEWRGRVNPVLAALAARSPVEVVSSHVAAIRSGVPLAMASHYAVDAEIDCPEGVLVGWDAIANYCESLVLQMDVSGIIWGAVELSGPEMVTVDWRFESDTQPNRSGCDQYEIREGRIVLHTRSIDCG